MKKLKVFILITVALNLLGCSTQSSSNQGMPLPTNLKERCRTDVPFLAGPTGVAMTATLDWYRDNYTPCAANHNGLLDALEKRGIK